MNSLTPVSEIEVMSPRVIRILGCNAGPIARQGSNMYLVGTGSRRALIDAGERDRPNYLANVKKVLTEQKVTELVIIVTHFHIDHCSGVDDMCHHVLNTLPDHPQEVLKIKRKNGAEEIIGDLARYKFIEDGACVKVEGATLNILHTPGHSDDHLCVHFEEENAVFVGDCILGDTYSCFFENYADLLNSMNRLLALKPSVLYSGHGPVITDPQTQITTYLQHRKNRENQVIEVLTQRERATVRDIVSTIYGTLPVALQQWMAEENILHHLEKLLDEQRVGRVTNEENVPVWFLVA